MSSEGKRLGRKFAECDSQGRFTYFDERGENLQEQLDWSRRLNAVHSLFWLILGIAVLVYWILLKAGVA